MSTAHKNECRGGARQFAKSISKRTADFIARVVSFATADSGYLVLIVVVVLQAALLALVEVLQ
jgi:hypothetical protein